MLGALTLLLIGSLLQGGLCGEWRAVMPQTVEAMKGSCVTIPCSFDVADRYEEDLNNECEAIWKNVNNGPQLTTTKGTTGDLTKKDCTSTFNNMTAEYNNHYYFRLECADPLKWNYIDPRVHLVVTDDPPTPTLTPSTLKVKEGSSVSLNCSAPAPCLTHPPTLTWTPSLGDVQEQLLDNEDKTKVKRSVLTFTASHLHHGRKISCTAVYKKQDGSQDASVSRSLRAAVSYSPKDITVSISPYGPVQHDSDVTLTCRSNANPAVRSYTWYRADGGQETVIGTKAILKMKASKDSRLFLCKATNDVGVGRSNLSQIDVQYSPQDITVSVSPSGPVQHDSNVALTCRSNANPAVRSYTWYRADGGQETVIGTKAVLKMKASEVSQTLFCEATNDAGVGRSNLSQIDVQFPPHILLSSDCTTTAGQVNCSCETVGNPSPTLHWYLDSQPVNRSDKFVISNECLNNDKGLRSFITLDQPQEMDFFNLVCHSFNSVGSASQQFCLENESPAENQDRVMFLVFITTIVVLLALVCALLCVIRVLKNRQNPNSHLQDEISQVASRQHATKDGAKPPMIELNCATVPNSGPNNAEGVSKSSEKNEESNVIYTTVYWKSKNKKGEDSANMNASAGSYQEEQRRMMAGIAVQIGNRDDDVESRNVRNEAKCEYAQVNFKGKRAKKQ